MIPSLFDRDGSQNADLADRRSIMQRLRKQVTNVSITNQSRLTTDQHCSSAWTAAPPSRVG
jgi:hypothetical protein